LLRKCLIFVFITTTTSNDAALLQQLINEALLLTLPMRLAQLEIQTHVRFIFKAYRTVDDNGGIS
jgi:hypothetical protein